MWWNIICLFYQPVVTFNVLTPSATSKLGFSWPDFYQFNYTARTQGLNRTDFHEQVFFHGGDEVMCIPSHHDIRFFSKKSSRTIQFLAVETLIIAVKQFPFWHQVRLNLGKTAVEMIADWIVLQKKIIRARGYHRSMDLCRKGRVLGQLRYLIPCFDNTNLCQTLTKMKFWKSFLCQGKLGVKNHFATVASFLAAWMDQYY